MMTRLRNLILLFISISLLSLPCLAQENFRAVRWGIEEKMSVAPAICMAKDANGFLWIGTAGGGLLRFDGTHFKKYHDEISKNKGLGSDDIRGLIEDSMHNIWIGTENGLGLYDINADTFRTVAIAGPNPANRAIVPFWATREEVFCWDYPEAQWTAFNIHTLSKRSLAKMSPDEVGDWFADRFSVFDSASNSIWIEKDSGKSFGGGLLQVSLSTGRKLPFSWPCYRNIPNHNHSFHCMHYDRMRNAIWINSADGLVEFTLGDKTFHHITAMDDLVRQKNYQSQDGITVDGAGLVWMGTAPDGIIVYDPTNGSLHLPFPGDSTLQHKVSSENLMIHCDPDGIVWISSWGSQTGMHQLIPFSSTVNHYVAEPGKLNSLSNDFAFLCLDAGQEKMWIGTGDGLNILDTKTGFFQVLRKKNLKGVESEVREIQPVCIDTVTQKSWILAGNSYNTAMRFYQMDNRTKQCTPVIFTDSNNQKQANQFGVPVTFKNGIVVGSVYGNRTLVFIGTSDSPVARQILSFPVHYIEPNQIGTDGDHLLFMKIGDGLGISYTLDHGKWKQTHTPLDKVDWQTIHFSTTDQTYWVNVKNTLQQFSRDFQLLRTYSQKDGLPDEERGFAIPDNDGNVWFTTDHLIYRLNSKTGKISPLTERDGFQATGFYPTLAIPKSSAGDLYIPSGVNGKGITRIRPDKYVSTTSAVYIQSLLVNQQPYYFSPGINREPDIQLSHFENRLTIEPGIIDFNSPAKNQFRYKLGASTDWIYPSNNTIYYDNLAPGDYDLMMQASATNDFNGPMTTLHLHIRPPWWQTWWAYTLFAIVFASLLWTFIQYRSRTLRAANIQLEEKVLNRTKELKHSLEDLRETQNQLIQREKMASLGELTAGIAHEIQNPLNFVNNFADVNADLLEEMKTEIKAGKPEEALALADDVIANEQKIIHHGKRADAIVKGMLQHSRTTAGQKELTDINVLADEYLRLSHQGLRATDKTFHVNLLTEFEPGLPKIQIIPQDMGRALLNLYNNAFYAVSEKKKLETQGFEPAVSVSTKKLNGKVEIRIKDNGQGIPQKILDKIFQPFFTTKPTGQGTGLGLSLSYDIVKAQGGEIKVETKEGEGAEFIIQLPA